MEGFTFTPQLGLIVGGLVGIIIGWAIGFFDSNRNSAKKIKQAEKSAAIAAQEARNKIAEFEAKAATIAASPVTEDDHIRNDIFKVFGGKRLDLPGMNEVEYQYLCLPLNDRVTVEDVRCICKLLNNGVARG